MATRISQHGIEVSRTDDANLVRMTQIIVEVLRVIPPDASRKFPITQVGLVTDNGGGTRVFPIVIT